MRKTEYNYQYTSAGKNDDCYTPREGVLPIVRFIRAAAHRDLGGWLKDKEIVIWCPFDTEESEYYKVLAEEGFTVELSDIKTGQDFFAYEPRKWDVMISNPPFTNKRAIFERALSFHKPFALLAPASWLNDSAPVQLFKKRNLQLYIFEKRLKFKNQEQKNKINFKAIYYCYKFLTKNIILEGE